MTETCSQRSQVADLPENQLFTGSLVISLVGFDCTLKITSCLTDQAPRAKMNQQRSRRFRASKEGVELTDEKNRIREEIIQRGV